MFVSAFRKKQGGEWRCRSRAVDSQVLDKALLRLKLGKDFSSVPIQRGCFVEKCDMGWDSAGIDVSRMENATLTTGFCLRISPVMASMGGLTSVLW